MKTRKIKKSEFKLTKKQAMERDGWSKTLVEKLLGEPDEIKEVKGYKYPLHLYLLKRIERKEKTKKFLAYQEELAKRRVAAQKAVETKIDNLIKQAEETVVEVETLPINELTELAIDAFNNWNYSKSNYDFTPASKKSNKNFLERITVNFIRHNLTNYDYELYEIAGKVGNQLAFFIVRDKIFDAIKKAYPMFKQECNKQLGRNN